MFSPFPWNSRYRSSPVYVTNILKMCMKKFDAEKNNILCTIYLAIFFFASLFAHLSSILNNFNCNDENWILGK